MAKSRNEREVRGQLNDRGRFVVAGAGPAGLAAAYQVACLAKRPLVLEQQALVGGLARTETYKGFRFDMGGHRFYSKSPEIHSLWAELLGPSFQERSRLSRIYYRGRFFPYPLELGPTLFGLGVWESLLCLTSYVNAQLRSGEIEDSFAAWVTSRFGRRLFERFFKTYTEKVWGVSCDELSADWAAQRIRNLTLTGALRSMLRHPGDRYTSLIDRFHYPDLGPGMMWDAVSERMQRLGGQLYLGTRVVGFEHADRRLTATIVQRDGKRQRVAASHVISSLAVTDLIKMLRPLPPDNVRAAAAALRYRSFLTVCLILKRAHLFPDNWIYVHDPQVRLARIQNYKNWSSAMVPDPDYTGLGLEYFCDQNDGLWQLADDALMELGTTELARIGLARRGDVVDGRVYRLPRAYPLYDHDYRQHLAVIRRYLRRFTNLQSVGRNGLHRYNNQDHAMMSGILAARNLILGDDHNVWRINGESDYLETMGSRSKPTPISRALQSLRQSAEATA